MRTHDDRTRLTTQPPPAPAAQRAHDGPVASAATSAAATANRAALLQDDVNQSPRMLAQRSTLNSAFGGAIQRHATVPADMPAGKPIQRMVICYTRTELGRPQAPNTSFDDEIIGQVIYARPSDLQYVGTDGSNTGSIKHHIPYNWIIKNLIDDCLEGKTRKEAAVALSLVLVRLRLQPPPLPREPFAASYNAWVDEVITSICDWPQNLFRDEPSSGDHRGTTIDMPGDAAVALRVTQAAAAYRELARQPL